MQIINIVPIANIAQEFHQPVHMYLTHLVEKYPHYVATARAAGGYKILDNSLIELGESVHVGRILKAAEEIEADEIILPDVFQNSDRTIRAVEIALHEIDQVYRDKCPYKLMAVAQGYCLQDWRECYMTFLENPKIDVIGIPKVCAKMLPGGRPMVMERCGCDLVRKPHHLLGLWYSAAELKQYSEALLQVIRSCDTVLASFLAKYELPLWGVRPDGFTVDLERDVIDPRKFVGYTVFLNSLGKGDLSK